MLKTGRNGEYKFIFLTLLAFIILSSFASATSWWIGQQPTGYWKFNETSGNAIDSSGNGFTLTNGGNGYSAGKLGNTATFVGATNLNTNTNVNSWNFGTQNFTIAFWMKTASGGNKGIITDANGWITAGCWEVIVYVNKVYFADADGGSVQGVTTVDDNNWHRVVMVREGTGANQFKIYLDGNPTPDKTGTSSFNANGAVRIQVGGEHDTYTTGIDNIDDVQIFNGYAWSSANVATDYNSGAGREADIATGDSIPPNATLISPANGTYSTTLTNFTVNLTDETGLANVTLNIYNNSGFLVNQTTFSFGAGILNSIVGVPVSLVDGVYHWFYTVFDLAGNSYTTNNNTVTIDTILPSVNIIYPLNTTYVKINVTDLNYTTDGNTCKYSLDLGVTNVSVACGTNLTGLTSIEGYNTWKVWVTDLAGNVNSSSVTFFKDTVPPVCKIISRNPIKLNDSSQGTFNVLINCTSLAGINTTKTGDHYWNFITRTLEESIIPGLPNFWTIRYPSNNLGKVDPTGTMTPNLPILRARDRNLGFWFEYLTGKYETATGKSFNDTLLNDTYSYAIDDGGNHGDLIINIIPGTNSALLNVTGLVEVTAFRQMFYLDKYDMAVSKKTNYTITKHNPILTQSYDFEASLNSQNYTMNIFRNLGYNNANPADVEMLIYYCNQTYSVAGSTAPASSGNCVQIETLLPTDITTYYKYLNSSYTRSTYSVSNGKVGGVTATPIYYFEYQTATPQEYYLATSNATNPTTTTFADTNVSWTSSDSGVTWVRGYWTPDVFTTTTKKTGDEFQFGIYVCDVFNNCYSNFTFFVDDVTTTNHKMSNPNILQFNSTGTLNDINMTGTHKGIMNILIQPAVDPDGTGTVNHNLSLLYANRTYAFTINQSFYSINDLPLYVNFNTALVADGSYKMNVYATANDNPLNIQNQSTTQNFIIDNTNPIINIVYPTATNYTTNVNALNYSVSDTNINTCKYSLDLGVTNVSVACGTNLTGLTSIEGYNTWKVWVTDLAGNVNSSSVTFFKDSISPVIQFVPPTQASLASQTSKDIVINVTATDTALTNFTIYLYNSTNSLINSSLNNSANGDYVIFYGLADGVYYYNATAYDSFGNTGNTETRSIGINTEVPVVIGGPGVGILSYTPVVLYYMKLTPPSIFAFNRTSIIGIETFDVNNNHVDIDNIEIANSTGIEVLSATRLGIGRYEQSIRLIDNNLTSVNLNITAVQSYKKLSQNINLVVGSSSITGFSIDSLMENGRQLKAFLENNLDIFLVAIIAFVAFGIFYVVSQKK